MHPRRDPNDPDNRTEKARRRFELAGTEGKCTRCPPHAGENVTRSKRGQRKPKHKNPRRR